MLSSFPKPPTSPPAQRLPDEDGASESKKISDHGIEGVQDDGGTLDALISRGGDDTRASETSMGYPMDENLFYTVSPQPVDPEATVEELGDEGPSPREMFHPADFRSFFTMIEDPETGEYHHPTVHYLFSDDDPEILTSAALDTLDSATDNEQPHHRPNDTSERCVIVDVSEDGKTVKSASSLSAEWQSLRATITQAPSWGEENDATDRGLLLKISGRRNVNMGPSKESKQRQEQEPADSIEELVKIYGERLERLDDVIGKS